MYEYEEGKEEEYTKIKNVPQDKVVAKFEGSWRGKITWKKTRGDDKVCPALVVLSRPPLGWLTLC